MKAKFLSVLATGLLIVGMASCSPVDSTTNTDKGSTSAKTGDDPVFQEKVSISFWNTKGSPYESIINAAIESFKEIQPNISVENVKKSVGISGLESEVRTGLTTGTYPDIVEGYPDNVSTYIDLGRAVELTDYVNDSTYGWTASDKEDVIKSYLDEGSQYLDEGLYSLPFAKSSEILLYNKKLIGVDLSGVDSTINGGKKLTKAYLESLTWEEFFGKLCPALTTYNNSLPDGSKLLDTSVNGATILGYDSDDNLAIGLTQQYGYKYTAITDGQPEALFNTNEVASKFYEFYEWGKKGYINTQDVFGSYTNSLVKSNAVLFLISSTGGLSHCQADGVYWGAAMPLQAEGKSAKVINQGPSICILDHAKDDSENAENRKMAAWLFYKHLTNYENNLSWALDGGYFPIRHSVINSAKYQAALNEDDAGSQDSTTYLTAITNKVTTSDVFQEALYTTPAFKGSSDCRTSLGGVITEAISKGRSDAEYTLDELKATLKKAYDAANLAINQ